ncbi:Zeta-sarcoglycan [Trachymyrmex cornetzi]|uniref:Zeta-sarcoglycan n=1 Tax=Trachymyrmex cornetzi TaxID=471704 RepID=A0A195E181_9HYME|nr:Zeta-sarcoglycan [Trachymyrmex cornetzi]
MIPRWGLNSVEIEYQSVSKEPGSSRDTPWEMFLSGFLSSGEVLGEIFDYGQYIIHLETLCRTNQYTDTILALTAYIHGYSEQMPLPPNIACGTLPSITLVSIENSPVYINEYSNSYKFRSRSTIVTPLSVSEGIGSLKVVPGGIELRGQAAVLDALVASSLRSRRGKNLVLESWSNFTASARSHDGRLLARLTVGEDRVDCVSRGFRITDPRGGVLFSADREQVIVGAEMLRVTGDGGAVFQGSVQTPLVRGESGRGLKLESATRSLKISAPQRVVIESWANEISASCLTDLKLQSVHGAIRLDAKSVYIKGLKTAVPVQGHSSREQQQQQQQHSGRSSSAHQSQKETTIYQLCACASGKLFLARPDGSCQADKSIC